jgi:molybdenum cofactor synthesis domain-containing protein
VASVKAAVLTVSTSKADGEGEDESGPRLAELLEGIGCEIARREVLPDDRDLIASWLRTTADEAGCELIATTGGTGMAPADVTPEATRDVIDREAPGIAEAMRLASREEHRHWMLSRGIAGIRGSTLIVNFPGSPRSIGEAGAAISESLPHALDLLADRHAPHG